MSQTETESQYRKDSEFLWYQVQANKYYQACFDKVVNGRKKEDILALPVDDLCSFWNDFWAALPDTPAIHRTPFNLLCSLCEPLEEDIE